MKALIKIAFVALLAISQIGAHAQTRKSCPITIVTSGPVQIQIMNGNGVWTKLPEQNFGIDSSGAIHVESAGNMMNITKNAGAIRIDFTVAVDANISNLQLQVTGAGVSSLSISSLSNNASTPTAAGYCDLPLSN